jgi:hypothetical protein
MSTVPIFAFKNISFNSLYGFLTYDTAKDYIAYKKKVFVEDEYYILALVNNYKGTLPNFENEIQQIIDTTDQNTIDYYFNELHSNLNYMLERFEPKAIISTIDSWNEDILKSFEEEMEKKTDEYFAHENRKLGHLEEYDGFEFSGLRSWSNGFGPDGVKRIKSINHNFYCIEDKPDIIEHEFYEEYAKFLIGLSKDLVFLAGKYLDQYLENEIKSKVISISFFKPVVFVEGDHDISYINKAAQLLGEEDLLSKVDLRQRGGSSQLNKLWTMFKENNWETIPQKKILLYDCDVKREEESSGLIYLRVMPTIPENKITRGIENLFPNNIIEKAISEKSAFIDTLKIYRTSRGEVLQDDLIYTVNDDEKKNLCAWICENGKTEDFKNFSKIFDLIRALI